jgi:hypothetical protein
VTDESPRDPFSPPPPERRDARLGFDLSLFWRDSSLWPVTFCAVVGLSALGAWAVAMALLQRSPFARMALAIAAAVTLFGMWDSRSRSGKLGGGAALAGVLWALSLAGGYALTQLGD